MKRCSYILLLFFLTTKISADLATTLINKAQPTRKQWTVLIFAAADNNLRDFAARNIKQMATIGSSSLLNIVVHLDIRLVGNRKTSRRYYIEKNQPIHVNAADDNKPPMDSGDPQTLISAAKWAIENYPAEHYALIFWNHGTGIIDPVGGRLLNMEDLYFYNAETGTYDLDRTIGFLDLIEMMNHDPKGICWDDTTGNYLTNQKLEMALAEICTKFLRGQKFDIIGFDACLMSMLEVADIVKKFARYQVSSQEVEPGAGWNYGIVFAPFAHGAPSADSFARAIVQAYTTAYHRITRDFTLSALDLSQVESLTNNVNTVAQLLLQAINADSATMKNIIRTCKSSTHCTHFDEPSYKDLYHFYSNLLDHLRPLLGGKSRVPITTLQSIMTTIEEGRSTMRSMVIANTTGPNLTKATGLSIYFPERKMHPSYRKTNFANHYPRWVELITQVLV